MMFKKIIISALFCLLIGCGAKPRAGSFYEQPEFMSLMPAQSWKDGLVTPDFAEQIFNSSAGDIVQISGEALQLKTRYVSALSMVCQKFSSVSSQEHWLLCAKNKTFNDAVIVRAF